MNVTDVLVNERALVVCSFLEPQDWPGLRRTSKSLAAACSDLILQGALRDMLSQIIVYLSAIKAPTAEDFHKVEFALRLFLAGKLGGCWADKVVENLVEAVRSWFKFPQGTVKNVNIEVQKSHKQCRTLLRNTDPKLWTSVAQAFPALSLSVCKIMLKWPLNYEDRDFLVGEIGATLPELAIASSSLDDNPSVASMGCQLAVMMSCGSEWRVALLEKELLSTKVVKALKQYGDEDDVILPSLGYLFNVAQCEQSWPTLVQLDVRPLCEAALQKLPNDMQIEQYAQYILDVLDFMESTSITQQH